MANLRKRSNGWQAQIRKKGQPSITKTFTQRKDALAWANTIESEIDRGVYVDRSIAEQTILGDLLDRYSADILPSLRGEKSEQSRLRLLRAHFSLFSLAQIKSHDLAEYRDMRLTHVGPQSVKHELGLLNRVLKIAHIEWGYTLPHGIPAVSLPKLPHGRERRLQGDEEAVLLKELRQTPIVQNIVCIAIETAMRRSEILNIERGHIHIDQRLLAIPVTKTNTPRTIPLSSRALEAINQLISLLGNTYPRFRADSVTQSFSRACKRSNIVNLHFHDLRHEATSRFFEKGLNIMEVSLITGHRSLAMLHRYTHLKPESLIEKLDAS
jgi:integrase